MGNHNVTVHQLVSSGSDGRAYLNVDDDTNGHIAVWTGAYTVDRNNKENPYVPLVFIMADSSGVYLSRFDSLAWARDYMTRHQKFIKWVKVVMRGGTSYHDYPYLKDVDIKEYLIDPDDVRYPGVIE